MDRQNFRKPYHWVTGSLRRRLLGIGLLFLGLALITNTLAGSLYTRNQIKKSATAFQKEMASTVAEEIRGFMDRKLERLLDLGTSLIIHEFGSEPQRLLSLLLLKNDAALTELAVLDGKGMEVVKVSERGVYVPNDLTDQSDTEKFAKAMRSQTYVSQVYFSDKAEPYVTLAVPLRLTPTHIIGAVSAEVNLRFLWHVVGDISFGVAGYAYLVDGHGNLIAHRDSSLVLKRTNLSHLPHVQMFVRNPEGLDPAAGDRRRGITGEPELTTFAPIRGLGWAVFVAEPEESALAEYSRLKRYAYLLLVIGMLVGASVIVLVSGKIAKPIRELQRGAKIIAGGNLTHRVEIKTDDEIEELAREFNRMAEELKASYGTLEQKVEYRTKELAALYDVSTTVNRSLELEPVLKEVMQKITEIFHFDATRIFLFDKEMKQLHLQASFETHPEFWATIKTFDRGVGVVGKVAETGEAMIFEDAQTDPQYLQLSQTKSAKKAGCSLFAVFPIMVKEKVVGVIVLVGQRPRKLSPEEIRLVNSMTAQIGVAVEKANLFQENLARSKELSALYDVTATLNQSMDPETAFTEAIHRVLEVTCFDAVRIYLLDPEGKELRLRAYQGISPEFASQTATDLVGVGISGRVAAAGRPFIFEDIQTDAQYTALAGGRLAQEAGFRAYVSLPLRTKTRTIGAINFLSYRPQRLLPNEIALLASMANQFSVAIENASLFEETVKKAQQFSALYGVTATANQSLDLQPVLQEVIKKITEIFHFDTMRIYLFDSQADVLWLKASYPSGRPDTSRVTVFKRGQGIVGRVVDTGEPMIFEDVQNDPRYRELSSTRNTHQTGFKFFAAFPIKAKLKSIGTIVCNSKTFRRLSADEIQLITSMTHEIGVAVENARLFEEVKRKSEELSALVRINRDVVALLDRQVLLPRIAEEAKKVLKADGASFRLLEDGYLVPIAFAGDLDLSALQQRVRLGESAIGKIVQDNRVLAIKNIAEDSTIIRPHREILVKAGYRSFLGVPLRIRDRVIGTINLYSKKEREFGPEETNLITGFADQAAIAIQNANLFAEVKRKTEELEGLNRELVEANRAKADFLAAMSHELRTPLNVIIGNADLMKDEFFGALAPKQKEVLEKILHHSSSLLKLINDVLTLTRIEARKISLHLSTFHVDEVIENTQNYVEQLNRDGRLEILWQVEPNLPPMTTDALKLEEILQNLIGNAYKFTPKGRIEIRVRNVPAKKQVEFSVADTGIGIKEKDLSLIFEQFHQLQEAHTGQYNGVGLGLSIVKRYLEMMQGDIRVESRPDEGSTFTFTLPYAIEA